MLNLHDSDRRVMTCTDVDDRTSINKQTVQESTNFAVSDRCPSVGFIATSVSISSGSLHSILNETLLMKKVSSQWVQQCYPMFRRQIELKHQQVCSVSSTKIPKTLFHDF